MVKNCCAYEDKTMDGKRLLCFQFDLHRILLKMIMGDRVYFLLAVQMHWSRCIFMVDFKCLHLLHPLLNLLFFYVLVHLNRQPA